jgi:hypothetical protein
VSGKTATLGKKNKNKNKTATATKKPMTLVERGIYVSGLCCSMMLEEQGSVVSVPGSGITSAPIMSAIRISDIFTVGVPEPRPNVVTLINPIEFDVAVMCKTERPERFPMRIALVKPSGERLPDQEFIIETKGSVHGHIIKVHTRINPKECGDYWFEVSVEGQLAIKIPVRVALVKPASTPRPSP